MPSVLKTYSPPSDALDVVHADDHLLVLNKPSGLLSVPGKAPEHADCLETRAKLLYPDALLVHRLDMETSGIFIMARNRETQRHLGLQFERRHARKAYVARVAGAPSQDNGTVDLPLICDWPNRPRQMVDHSNGKQAITHWTVMERENERGTKGATGRLELRPQTGRSHQLRVHMLAIGHPILGDQLYGEADVIKAANRLQLHARDLSIFHPAGKQMVTFTSPVPF